MPWSSTFAQQARHLTKKINHTYIEGRLNVGRDQIVSRSYRRKRTLPYIIKSKGADRAKYLLSALEARARLEGVDLEMKSNTPYINTINKKQQPAYPGNREIERRIKSFVRWNAMAMVVKANKATDKPGLGGVGGHISTFASSATLYEVGYNHFFRGRGESGYNGDQIYFQGHGSPGMYSRAFMEGRLKEDNLLHFRQELNPEVQGLSSYPHPWLMPSFWEYPTVSMGLGPIMSIYRRGLECHQSRLGR